MSDTEPHRQDIGQPTDDLDLVALSIQDAREYLPRDAERVEYHLRQAQQLLATYETTVWVVPTHRNSRWYHTDRDCPRLPDDAEVRERAIAQVGRRECCRVCAGETTVNDEPDWDAYRAARDAEVER
jgi:hypothetical protein